MLLPRVHRFLPHAAVLISLALSTSSCAVARALCPWCHKSVSKEAQVDCRDTEKYECRLGILNEPQFSLGSVIVVNLHQKTGASPFIVVPTDADCTETTPVDTTEIVSNGSFHVKVTASMPADLSAQVETALNNNTLLFVLNHKRRSITNAITLVNARPEKSQIATILRSGHGNVAVLLVNAIVKADELHFTLKKGGKYDVKANLLKLYSCDGSLRQVSHQAGALFKFIPLKVEGDSLQLDPDGPASLATINLNRTN